ncbi:MAG: AAA family ATPase [Actinobacteria bacterium]|nr:AAA family ATPase [Actinomycetota bacterium]
MTPGRRVGAPAARRPPGRGWPLVGRIAELDRVLAAFDAGDPGAALVVGPPGVGKTRLAEEVGIRVAARGARVVRALASPAIEEIPLGALAGLLAPEGDGGDAEPGGPVQGLVAALAREGDRSTQLLVVDDLAHLDAASVEVVDAVVRAGAAFVLATLRSGAMPPGAARWAELAVRVELGELPRTEVARLLELGLSGAVSGDTVQQVWQAARGNPLLIRELVRAALDDHELVEEEGVWHTTAPLAPNARMRELVAARFTRLRLDDRAALDLVAVAESLPRHLAEALVHPETLDRLAEAGLVETTDAAGEEVVRPAHPVYREVLREELGLLHQRSLAARLADAAERSGAGDPERAHRAPVDVLRRVAWRVQAGGTVQRPLLLEAASEARRRSQAALAARLLEAALAESWDPQVALALADARLSAGRRSESIELLRRIESELPPEVGAGTGDGHAARLRADVAVRLAAERAWIGADPLGARDELLSLAGAFAGAGWPAQSHAVSAEAAMCLALSGGARAARAELEALLDGSDLEPRVEAEARLGLGLALPVLGLGRTAGSVLSRVTELGAAQPAGSRWAPTLRRAHLFTSMAALRNGDLGLARIRATTVYDAAVSEGDAAQQAASAVLLGWVEINRGHARSALRWLREAQVAAGGAIGPLLRSAAAGRASALLVVGELEAAEAVLDEVGAAGIVEAAQPDDVVLADGIGGGAALVRALAGLLALRGEVGRAVDVLVAAADAAAVQGLASVEAELLHWVLHLGDGRSAAAIAPRLATVAEHVEGPLASARRAHASAVVARSAAGLLDAAERFARLGFVLQAAGVAQAAAHRARVVGQAGVASSADTSIRAWLATAELGPAADPGVLARLGPRQREVVRLAASGLTNAAIAERLGVSLRTVENHLHRAYQELGVSRRADLIGLVDGTGTGA